MENVNIQNTIIQDNVYETTIIILLSRMLLKHLKAHRELMYTEPTLGFEVYESLEVRREYKSKGGKVI